MTTPAQRTQLARIAALSRVATEGGSAVAAHLNGAGKLARYMARVDPDGVLDIEERTVRAKALLRADMQRLAMRRAEKRKQPTT